MALDEAYECGDYDYEEEEEEQEAEEEQLMPRALAVEGTWDPEANPGPPMDGMEYLRRVRYVTFTRHDTPTIIITLLNICRWEAARTPNIVQVTPDPNEHTKMKPRNPSRHVSDASVRMRPACPLTNTFRLHRLEVLISLCRE